MKLKEYLDKQCFVHARFAIKLGIKRSAFCRYVNGSRRPDKETAKKIKAESKGLVTEFDDIISSS